MLSLAAELTRQRKPAVLVMTALRMLRSALPSPRLAGLFIGALIAPLLCAQDTRATPMPAGAILQELQSFQQLGRVLYVAAHPDDENTRLLAYFAKGRGYRTGYLSLTRGDGGQNLIGTELRDSLGVIRTQELLAARRVDGAVQLFSRANDFGFSKHPDETFRIWDRQQVLSDVVRAVRRFRPDVMITRFSTEPGTTHGHHTASAILAVEAFQLAGDPKAFPEQITRDGLSPWQPKRVLWNAFPAAFRSSERSRTTPPPVTLQVDSGSYNPLLGESFGEIAARSRTQHKSQGFGTLAVRGSAPDYFQVIAGEPATTDVMEGVDSTWQRLSGGAEIGVLAKEIGQRFNPRDPAASVADLLALRTLLAALDDQTDPVRIADKRVQLDELIFACLGIFTEATVPSAEVCPGDTLALKLKVLSRTQPNGLPVRWKTARLVATGESVSVGLELTANQAAEASASPTLAGTTLPSTPYWLREEGSSGLFKVADPMLIGRPENPPVFPVEHVLEIGGQTLVVHDHVVQVIDDPIRGEIRRALQVVPPVSLHFPQELELVAPGATRDIALEVIAVRGKVSGEIQVESPSGWKVTPASAAFSLASPGSRGRFLFSLTAPQEGGVGQLGASALVGGTRFRTTRTDIQYDHIPAQLLQPPARAKVVSMTLETRGKSVAYLPGAGDLVAESISRMGYQVTTIGSSDLKLDRLRPFDAVVLGVRALNVRSDIGPLMPALFAYAEQGGTVIVQYNTTNDLQTTTLAPYPLTLSRDRVVEENATVRFLAPDHRALTQPNRLGTGDFDEWVQERGLYFPNSWDSRYTALLTMNDAGETPKTGSLLVANHGKGYFVYTGLSFFRELPSGVPGAYRLFANLLSLGK